MLVNVIRRVVYTTVIANLFVSQAQIIGGLYTRFCGYVRLPAYCPSSFEAYSFPPLVIAQTQSTATSPFTFPTIYTVPARPGVTTPGTPQTTPPIRPPGPALGQQMCPPFISVCPPNSNAPIMPVPSIDPRFVVRQVNGCPCIDARSPGLAQSAMPGAIPSPSTASFGSQPISPMGPSVGNFPGGSFGAGAPEGAAFPPSQPAPTLPSYTAGPGMMGSPSAQPLPNFPSQGFPGPGFPAQNFPGQGFPGQNFPAQGFPGQGAPSSASAPSQFGSGFPFSPPPFPNMPLPPNMLLRSG